MKKLFLKFTLVGFTLLMIFSMINLVMLIPNQNVNATETQPIESYDATEQFFNQISAKNSTGNMNSIDSITQSGPWTVEWRDFYPNNGAWTASNKYK